METKLKEKDPYLFFLIQKSGYDAYEQARTILSTYKTDDDVLNGFVIEVRNKIVKDSANPELISKTINDFLPLLMTASNKIVDISTISNSLSKGNNSLDALILFDILDQRLDKKEVNIEKINSTVKNMLLNPNSRDVIKEQILNGGYKARDWSLNPQFTKLIRLLAVTKDQNLAYIIKEILYSPKVNELNPNLIRQSVPLMASILNIDYINALEDLVLNFISNEKILYGLKAELENSNNKEVDTKLEIAKIYLELYAPNTGRLVDNYPEILSSHSDEMLKLFISTIDSRFANKKDTYNQSDLVSALISLNKSELAMQLFEKSCYKPIDITKRKEELKHPNRGSLYGSDFSSRLNLIIHACLDNFNYETLFKILAHKKVSSLAVHYMHDILTSIAFDKIDKGGIHHSCPIELRDKIIEIVRNKINEEKLIVYTTMNHWSERNESLFYDKDKALRYVDFVNAHLEMNICEVKEAFVKK
jgi:hypothetical protein